MDHPVHHRLVAGLDPAPHAVDVVRRVRHRLLAPGHDAFGVAGLDGLGREHDRLEAGAAHLVDRERGDAGGKSRLDQGLTGRRLAAPALDHLAHDHFFYGGGIDAGAGDGIADDHRAELGRAKRRESAEIAADGRPNGGQDDRGCFRLPRPPPGGWVWWGFK